MVRNDVTVRIPNPHRGDIGVVLLTRILRQAGITRDEWERVLGSAGCLSVGMDRHPNEGLHLSPRFAGRR
jgi:hypothetical protein